ncbi:3-phosphoshikimate 1-carboxyvinyltransferase [Sporosarcina saromensis]|uniref:3-phosphoshikimate 1-carboxyvinyltransferase n=1 Tax=Sporosarcina saromensis TaxID=359365 RepID=A0ABU4G3S0_9BACL|nr:3-phosphoshikimate 1-carboxyvinyltransferase [Sporosarcina saromensis]MDW0111618.1 3-phosphoshikimate 1-carboxyvinyltransferase [Sporosarcina saromensis]
MAEQKTLQFHKPRLNGSIKVPGDKSISHRSIMLGAIAEGRTTVEGFLEGEDCLRTIEIFKQLGVSIERQGTNVTIDSPGIENWTTPSDELYAGNSGTTARLMLGILAGSNVSSVLTGDESLSKRPMKRVTIPLQSMGAKIVGAEDDEYLPLTVKGGELSGMTYHVPVASAQVKSAILFAGLRATGKTIVSEPAISRDHTERMFEQFGVSIETNGNTVTIEGGQTLQASSVKVPGDISSAAFFLAAAAMVENSCVEIVEVGLNPTRTGIIEVLRQMGAAIDVHEETGGRGESYGTIKVSKATLHGIEISGEIIPTLIDELPIIALLATQAEGTTIIKDAAELRVKETDRIAAVTTELKKLGASIEATPDGMIIHGPTPLKGTSMNSYGDHRLGMMAAIASLVADGEVIIEDPACIAVSYPNFFEHLTALVNNG